MWIILSCLMLFWGLFRHPVGDYGAESDFYQPYAAGARLIQQGVLDFRRYSVVGPVYELALGGLGLLTHDLFVAAKLISFFAAALTLWITSRLAGAIGGWRAAIWSLLLCAFNPTFFQYSYSVTTDMLALGLGLSSVWLASGGSSLRRSWSAGLVVGLAILTRYTYAVVLAPAVLAAMSGPARRLRVPRIAALLLGCASLVGPSTIASVRAGYAPGALLVQDYGFWSSATPPSQAQDRLIRSGSAPDSLLFIQAPRIQRWSYAIRNVPGHASKDVNELVGWPVAFLALVGFLSVLWRVEYGRVVICYTLLLFAMLLLTFWSERYAACLVPACAVAAAVGVEWIAARWSASPIPRFLGTAVVALVGTAGVLLAVACVRKQLEIAHYLPVETLEAGAILAADSRPGDRVLSRKSHVPYYAGRRGVPFPRLESVNALASAMRKAGARYLYYSWYESRLRPEFAFLLDTTAAVPGLERLYDSRGGAAGLFRVGPSFGESPMWARDSSEVLLHNARGLERVLGKDLGWPHSVALAAQALKEAQWPRALNWLDVSLAHEPDDVGLHIARGLALRKLRRFPEARDAYRRAIALEPDNAMALIGLGETSSSLGRLAEAQRAWQQALARASTPGSLEALIEGAERAGQTAIDSAARRKLRKLQSQQQE